jgi:uncharacterized membrane protein
MEQIREWIDWTAQAIEALAVLVMVVFIIVGTVRWLMVPREATGEGYARYRVVLGKSLLVGLELLVAADIIRTVVLEPTLPAIGALGLLMLVRTFLGWTVNLEVEGRWPWQARPDGQRGPERR